ncbi:hypothetical protein EIN_262960 [Entamoeba invadens IP1]|uniref:Uncharacterized protein n=2 Tax=Entamoeba invadens IP1 TaxID=370355 RepID=L7FNW5_ENTIV|nr:hypothetical protein EIN_262960 [Entamoeba invadens IP1]ELP92952.1 hypothetical protein EIN_262960 [Entamoeba invadens IP1]|eukprot:XP_004259723.1 hypothetical protein EIN_262960 [Entamoeba invadens IP1]
MSTMKLYLGRKILRICPLKLNYDIGCILEQKDMGIFSSYRNALHCPILNENTTIYIETNEVILNIGFNGTFNQNVKTLKFKKINEYNTNFKDSNTANVIYISNESINNNNISVSNKNIKLLVGEEYGFKNTNNITTQMNDVVFNDKQNCTALYIDKTDISCKYYKNSYLLDNQCKNYDNNCGLSTTQTNVTTKVCESCPDSYHFYKN